MGSAFHTYKISLDRAGDRQQRKMSKQQAGSYPRTLKRVSDKPNRAGPDPLLSGAIYP